MKNLGVLYKPVAALRLKDLPHLNREKKKKNISKMNKNGQNFSALCLPEINPATDLSLRL